MEKNEDRDYSLKELGIRVRTLRKRQGLSQVKFAKMVGIDRTYLIDIEHGNRNLSWKNLVKISEGFGLSISQLTDGVHQVKGATDVEYQA